MSTEEVNHVSVEATLNPKPESTMLLPKKWKICPKCEQEYRNLLPSNICIDCDNKAKRKKESWGLPSRYIEMTLSNFKQNNQNQKILYEAAKEFFINDKGLFICGGAGQGKTHIAIAIMQQLQGSGQYIKFESVPELFLKLRAGFNTEGFSEIDFISQYGDHKYLVLDDLGAEKVSDYNLQTLYLIFDRRYRNMLNKMVLTSNLSLQQLAEYTTDRICSRIAEMCRIVEVQGKDWRLQR